MRAAVAASYGGQRPELPLGGGSVQLAALERTRVTRCAHELLWAHDASEAPCGNIVISHRADCRMTDFKDKFIAFVDILGFKAMVEAAERGQGRTRAEITLIASELGQQKDKDLFDTYGARKCPHSRHLQKNLDFQITQVSDCAIVSTEISPAGAINLIGHCWGAAISLLSKGVLVRGYITRGSIYHVDSQFMGTGYQNALEAEKAVTAFKKTADEKGTPFIEIDPIVSRYVGQQTDQCVREMFSRFTRGDGSSTAVFPFHALAHSFVISGSRRLDINAEKQSNDTLRKGLKLMQSLVTQHVDPANKRAFDKVQHYVSALDTQLQVCDRTDKVLDELSRRG